MNGNSWICYHASKIPVSKWFCQTSAGASTWSHKKSNWTSSFRFILMLSLHLFVAKKQKHWKMWRTCGAWSPAAAEAVKHGQMRSAVECNEPLQAWFLQAAQMGMLLWEASVGLWHWCLAPYLPLSVLFPPCSCFYDEGAQDQQEGRKSHSSL